MHKDFLALAPFTPQEVRDLLDLARQVKLSPRALTGACASKTLAMIFQKPSLRTRVSFETAMYELGGQAIYLGPTDIQIHRGETIADTARVLSRYAAAIMARVFAHQDILELAAHATRSGHQRAQRSAASRARCSPISSRSASASRVCGDGSSPTSATGTTWPTRFSRAAP